MGDILTYSIFFGLWICLCKFGEWLKAHKREQKMQRSSKVIQYRYIVLYNWLYSQYAKKYRNELPDFMNREIISRAHAEAVGIAQSGNLHKVYKKLRDAKCV